MSSESELVARDIICVGASSGGVGALVNLVSQLPLGLPAAVFVVLHTGPRGPGALPSVLGRATPWPVAMAAMDEPIVHGRIRVAPPDHHLVLVDGHTRLDRGPTENRVRPAVDTLFRSAAVTAGARTIGIVLTGHLSDGSAGAAAIKRAGGLVLVQSPEDAECPSMPRAAIDAAAPDYVVPLASMGELLARLVVTPTHPLETPHDLALEMNASTQVGETAVQINDRIGRRAPYTCPDCGGPLWARERPSRFRCELGHTFNHDVLERAKSQDSVQALWVAARTLDERARLLDDMARNQRVAARTLTAELYEARAAEVQTAADQIRKLLGSMPPGLEPVEP